MLASTIQQKIHDAVKDTSLPLEAIQLTYPENPTFGDFATNVAMRLTKELGKNPMEIAESIAAKIDKGDVIEKVEVVKPGFINIHLFSKVLVQQAQMFAEINEPAWFATIQKKNTGKEAIVEFSSPNIAKPFTVGHLRSTIIGNAVANILQATGYKVYRDNHLGDWGTQFGKQIYAIKHLGENNEDRIEKAERPIQELVKLYVTFHEEAEKHPEIEEEARNYFKKLEDGDPEMKRLWQRCINWSFKEFDSIYSKLDVSFTENDGRGYGESFFEDKMTPVIEELKAKLPDSFKENKNAWLFYFENDKYPPLMIVKQDGATLYSTRDLATDKFRKNNYPNVSLIINEVGAEQSLYFNQLYEIEQKLGWYEKHQRVHLKHGMYRFKDMKMSTRKGNVIWLEDVLEEATKKADVLNKDNLENVSEVVGLGALKWNDLKRSSHIDIVFDWEDILNMQGNSGPYMQYSYVRTKSILAKQKYEKISEENFDLNEDEKNLFRLFHQYPGVVDSAAKNYSVHLVSTYLYEVAQKFNLFYQKNPIIKSEGPSKQIRLLITQVTSNILHHGLALLGIKTVEKM